MDPFALHETDQLFARWFGPVEDLAALVDFDLVSAPRRTKKRDAPAEEAVAGYDRAVAALETVVGAMLENLRSIVSPEEHARVIDRARETMASISGACSPARTARVDLERYADAVSRRAEDCVLATFRDEHRLFMAARKGSRA